MGFAHDPEVDMNYIEMSNTLEIREEEYNAPCNWILARKRQTLRHTGDISPDKEVIQ